MIILKKIYIKLNIKTYKETNINFIDVLKISKIKLKIKTIDLYRPSDNHLSLEGYKILANIIDDYL